MGIGDETSASGGSKTVRALFQTDAQRYLAHLKQQFLGTDVAGLATKVESLLADPRYSWQVERAVSKLKEVAVNSGFINHSNNPTLRAKVHLGVWYLPQGLPNYQAYAQKRLDELVREYKPRETKKWFGFN